MEARAGSEDARGSPLGCHASERAERRAAPSAAESMRSKRLATEARRSRMSSRCLTAESSDEMPEFKAEVIPSALNMLAYSSGQHRACDATHAAGEIERKEVRPRPPRRVGKRA